MTLDHLGIAATPSATALFTQLLGAAPYKRETVPSQGVTTVFFGDGGRNGAAPKLELLLSEAGGSPIATFLDKRGPGLHHLAFEVADLDAEMARVRDLGIRVLGESGPGADGKQIVFLHPKDTGGVLVELCTTPTLVPRPLSLDLGGHTLTGWTAGPDDAPPLVALHGAQGSSEQLRPFAPVWAREFRVIAIDLPAHGGSSDTGPLSWASMTAWVQDALAALALEHVRLFGYSMGAGVALSVAASEPERVERVAVHAVSVQWTEREVELMGAGTDPDALPASAQSRLADLHGSRWRETLDRVDRFSRGLPDAWITDPTLATIRQPTLVSIGAQDRLFETESALHLARALPDADLWVVPRADHALATLDTDAFAREIAAHLR